MKSRRSFGCVCATCHVIVENGYVTLNEMPEDGKYMLNDAESVVQTSRLACPYKITTDLAVMTPEKPLLFEDGPDG